MREIKFRAWSKKENKYYYEVGFHRSIIMWNDGYKKDALGALTVSPLFENYIIDQFTGLHDKNGKEIYEGDIVTWFDRKDQIWEVKWENIFSFSLWHPVDKCIVIGNIHENPELIK